MGALTGLVFIDLVDGFHGGFDGDHSTTNRNNTLIIMEIPQKSLYICCLFDPPKWVPFYDPCRHFTIKPFVG